MTDDIIERAEAAFRSPHRSWQSVAKTFIPELIAELKAARAEVERLRSDYSVWENCTCPASSLFSGSVGHDCPTHGGQ